MKISGATRVFAVVGNPVQHSRSPELHNRWFAELGVDAVYVALPADPARASELPSALRTLGLAGVNLTVPFKEAVLDGLDVVHPTARALGAINTVVCSEGRLVGHNTDADGYVDGLVREHGEVVRGARVAVLGAGGAGRAVGLGLGLRGAVSITWLNRTPARAEEVARRSQPFCRARCAGAPLTPEAFAALAPELDLIVNATTGPAASLVEALPIDALRDTAIWSDVNYWQRDPPRLAACAARGLRTQDGWPMLVLQAARAFELFTGLRPDPAPVLRRVV